MKLLLDRMVERTTTAATSGVEWLRQASRKIATATVLALALWVAFHVVTGPNGMMEYGRKKSEYRALENDVDRLKRENEQLSERIRALKSDPRAIEKEAREQLRYARPGEVVYVMPGEQPVKPPANARAEVEKK